MGPQHSYRGSVMPLIVFVAFTFTPTLSSAPDESPSSSYTLFESGQVRPP